eukprot:5759563-Prymnesium_polylepis.1
MAQFSSKDMTDEYMIVCTDEKGNSYLKAKGKAQKHELATFTSTKNPKSKKLVHRVLSRDALKVLEHNGIDNDKDVYFELQVKESGPYDSGWDNQKCKFVQFPVYLQYEAHKAFYDGDYPLEVETCKEAVLGISLLMGDKNSLKRLLVPQSPTLETATGVFAYLPNVDSCLPVMRSYATTTTGYSETPSAAVKMLDAVKAMEDQLGRHLRELGLRCARQVTEALLKDDPTDAYKLLDYLGRCFTVMRDKYNQGESEELKAEARRVGQLFTDALEKQRFAEELYRTTGMMIADVVGADAIRKTVDDGDAEDNGNTSLILPKSIPKEVTTLAVAMGEEKSTALTIHQSQERTDAVNETFKKLGEPHIDAVAMAASEFSKYGVDDEPLRKRYTDLKGEGSLTVEQEMELLKRAVVEEALCSLSKKSLERDQLTAILSGDATALKDAFPDVQDHKEAETLMQELKLHKRAEFCMKVRMDREKLPNGEYSPAAMAMLGNYSVAVQQVNLQLHKEQQKYMEKIVVYNKNLAEQRDDLQEKLNRERAEKQRAQEEARAAKAVASKALQQLTRSNQLDPITALQKGDTPPLDSFCGVWIDVTSLEIYLMNAIFKDSGTPVTVPKLPLSLVAGKETYRQLVEPKVGLFFDQYDKALEIDALVRAGNPLNIWSIDTSINPPLLFMGHDLLVGKMKPCNDLVSCTVGDNSGVATSGVWLTFPTLLAHVKQYQEVIRAFLGKGEDDYFQTEFDRAVLGVKVKAQQEAEAEKMKLQKDIRDCIKVGETPTLVNMSLDPESLPSLLCTFVHPTSGTNVDVTLSLSQLKGTDYETRANEC